MKAKTTTTMPREKRQARASFCVTETRSVQISRRGNSITFRKRTSDSAANVESKGPHGLKFGLDILRRSAKTSSAVATLMLTSDR